MGGRVVLGPLRLLHCFWLVSVGDGRLDNGQARGMLAAAGRQPRLPSHTFLSSHLIPCRCTVFSFFFFGASWLFCVYFIFSYLTVPLSLSHCRNSDIVKCIWNTRTGVHYVSSSGRRVRVRMAVISFFFIYFPFSEKAGLVVSIITATLRYS